MDTIRKQIMDVLAQSPSSARQISQELGISERDVYEHLPFVARTTEAKGRRLVTLPFSCMACGFSFQNRRRLTRPGRCPRCKSGHVEEPRFQIE